MFLAACERSGPLRNVLSSDPGARGQSGAISLGRYVCRAQGHSGGAGGVLHQLRVSPGFSGIIPEDSPGAPGRAGAGRPLGRGDVSVLHPSPGGLLSRSVGHLFHTRQGTGDACAQADTVNTLSL